MRTNDVNTQEVFDRVFAERPKQRPPKSVLESVTAIKGGPKGDMDREDR